LNLENDLTKDFSKDCQNFEEINRELIDFDAVRKELWAQLSSVDAIDLTTKLPLLIEIIDIRYYSTHNINELAKEMRRKVFESLVLLINEGKLKIDFNQKCNQFNFKRVFCHGKKEDIRAYDYLKSKIANVINPFGKCYISLNM
jgi:hypothetical protein